MQILRNAILLNLLSLFNIYAKTAEEWKSRIIYQLLTDRFAKTDGNTSPCSDLTTYCGGTFKGIQENLDYIQGMGFNAVWISPVQVNAPNGYHGYWITNFYEINKNFGTEKDFKDLIKACHDRDIWLIVDIVVNHVAYVQNLDSLSDVKDNDYANIIPFNDKSHFHEPLIECDDAELKFPGNQNIVETCWLHWLPDLDQSHPYVRKTLLEWISWFVKTYEIDGLRLDAVRHVPKNFWVDFKKEANIFTIGESFEYNLAYLAQYQGVVDSPANFALHTRLYTVFIKNGSMKTISHYYEEAFVTWPDITIVTNFLNIHDNPRFLSYTADIPAFKAGLAFILCSVGIPNFYYGDEQAFDGGADPLNREPLWTNMNPKSEIYQFVKSINNFRYETKFNYLEQIELYVDDSFYVFSRGNYIFAFTNSPEEESRFITNSSYDEDTLLCNILNLEDCIKVQNGNFRITLLQKEVKILFPKSINSETNSFVTKDAPIHSLVKAFSIYSFS